jgi:hypothetical protein
MWHIVRFQAAREYITLKQYNNIMKYHMDVKILCKHIFLINYYRAILHCFIVILLIIQNKPSYTNPDSRYPFLSENVCFNKNANTVKNTIRKKWRLRLVYVRIWNTT